MAHPLSNVCVYHFFLPFCPQVLWHKRLRCAEFKALPEGMRGESDQALMQLAAKRSWKQ